MRGVGKFLANGIGHFPAEKIFSKSWSFTSSMNPVFSAPEIGVSDLPRVGGKALSLPSIGTFMRAPGQGSHPIRASA
jgi:hypothetical protein